MADDSTKQPDQTNDGTRDLFLSYNSRDRAAVVRLQELLQKRAIKTFFDRNDLTPGLPWQNELERAIAQVRAVAVLIGGEGIGAWQRPEKELALDRQVREEKAGRRFPVIPVLLPDAEAGKITGFLTRNTWIDLRGGLDNPAATAALDALARAVTGELSSASTPAPEPLCPYRGLEPFHEDDAPLFFGRDKFADDLLQKVLAHPLIAVVGPSGSGKSSVVQAGLLPRLRREGWPNKTWEAVIFTPREHPFHSLAKELLPLYETAKSKTEQMIEARTLAEALAAVTIPLDDPINAALKAAQTTNRLLLVVDQFEELFTLAEERYRQPFIESLIAAATRADSPVTVVLTLRADFYGQAISLSRNLSDSIQQGLVNLGPMTRDELRQAIEEPAQRVGLSFEPGLVARLLDDVKGQPGNLPLLEFALKELCKHGQGRAITNQQYDEIGNLEDGESVGLEGVISKRADVLFEGVPPAARETVLRALTRLVRVAGVNEEGTDTRQRVRLKDLDAAAYPVVKSFVRERLLVMSRDEETNEETIEIAHEALIKKWKRIRESLNKERGFLLWRQGLSYRLSDWQRLSRDEGELLRGASLIEAKRIAEERAAYLSIIELEFIQSSAAAAAEAEEERKLFDELRERLKSFPSSAMIDQETSSKGPPNIEALAKGKNDEGEKADARIFLSYAHEDRKVVSELYGNLLNAGFRPWMADEELLPGENWEPAIVKAIRSSDFILVCLSSHSVNKRGYLQKEIKVALDLWQEKLEDEIYLIPVRLDDCLIPEALSRIQWVNLFEETGWARLLKAIQFAIERRRSLY